MTLFLLNIILCTSKIFKKTSVHMFYRKLTKKDGSTYHYILKSIYDKRKRCSVHKKIANITELPEEMIEAIKSMLKGKRVVLTAKEEKIIKIE